MERAAAFFFFFPNTRRGGFVQTVVKGSGAQWRAAREAMTLLEAVAGQLNYPSVHFHSTLFLWDTVVLWGQSGYLISGDFRACLPQLKRAVTNLVDALGRTEGILPLTSKFTWPFQTLATDSLSDGCKVEAQRI